MSAQTVDDRSEKLQSAIRFVVVPVDICLDARVVLQIAFLLPYFWRRCNKL